jgi:hypothetical protein
VVESSPEDMVVDGTKLIPKRTYGLDLLEIRSDLTRNPASKRDVVTQIDPRPPQRVRFNGKTSRMYWQG